MNITFQAMNPSYRSPVPTQAKRTPQVTKAKGDYDTVKISRTQAPAEDDETFARMLARKTAAQLGSASQERVQELGSRVANGTYVPDAQRIAGRMLGLG
ncbi:MAG: flagellar biosynthesis anti-sigma factor FlgM [Hungatella sp.]|nr:flagellar biosynthesis anti-sigma factor FlgM [Hungatella sp.]